MKQRTSHFHYLSYIYLSFVLLCKKKVGYIKVLQDFIATKRDVNSYKKGCEQLQKGM